jgi:glyoxylase-like metal-dependent hydrolase (beta-lactamase superfamily II)
MKQTKTATSLLHGKQLAFTLLFVITLYETGAAQGVAIPFDKIEMITTPLTPHFYTFTGSPDTDPGHADAAGGRIGALIGDDGVFLVDCNYAPMTDKITAAIKKVTDKPIRFLVNTHEHPDHTGGNAHFARLGAILIGRQEVRDALAQPFPPAIAAAIGNAASNGDPAGLPMLVYDGKSVLKIYFNGETIDIIPLQASHTNGDAMVKFEQQDVIMIGDIYRNYGYPFVDPSHGGNYKGLVAAIDTLLKIAGPGTRLVPGHGTIINRSALIPYRNMILEVQNKVHDMVLAHKTKQEVLSAKLTAPYDATVPGGTTPLPLNLGTSADRFVGNLYDELTK